MKSLFITLLLLGGVFAAYDYFLAPPGQKMIFKDLNPPPKPKTVVEAAPEPESVAMTGRVEGWILGSSWPPIRKQRGRVASTMAQASTTTPDYINRNRQEVLSKTGLPGNDHNQVVYLLKCHTCGARYGANGSDIFQRRCPECDGGRPGLGLG